MSADKMRMSEITRMEVFTKHTGRQKGYREVLEDFDIRRSDRPSGAVEENLVQLNARV
jgi:hypothetical protein